LVAAERGWGLFPAIGLSAWLAVILSLLVLDAAIYAQHVVFHKVPLLWRLHKVHHSDVEFDTTTAIRFHPLEIVLSMFFKMALVAAFGIAPGVVLAFEALLNACAQFNHGNVRLSERTERAVRLLLITPDLHRVHHSRRQCETDSNFGFSVPWWDRLFGTYLSTPDGGQEGLQIGLDEWRDPARLRFIDLLKIPFQSNAKTPLN
jgi:sterol desaturase/sphingolipid hydroxylase (fatty acid hydroxylase superfamily)